MAWPSCRLILDRRRGDRSRPRLWPAAAIGLVSLDPSSAYAATRCADSLPTPAWRRIRPAAASPTQDIETAAAELNRTLPRSLRRGWSVIELVDGATSRRVTRSAQSAPEAACSQIADAAIALFTGPERESLRACHAPGCVLYFVKQHPRREWCSAACGNRARVARHYQRHSHDQP